MTASPPNLDVSAPAISRHLRTLDERFPDEAERANHDVGWTQSLARLVEHAAAAGVGDAPA